MSLDKIAVISSDEVYSGMTNKQYNLLGLKPLLFKEVSIRCQGFFFPGLETECMPFSCVHEAVSHNCSITPTLG